MSTISVPSVPQAALHPLFNTSQAVKGIMKIAPKLLPMEITARARPRMRMNHLETSTFVTRMPSSLRPSAVAAV